MSTPTKLCLIASLALAACDQRADVGDIPNMPVTTASGIEGMCQRIADPLCDSNLDCCHDTAQTYSSKQACMTTELSKCRLEMDEEVAIRTGKIVVDEAGLTAFVADFKQVADTCVPPLRYSGLPLRGTLLEGQDCSFTENDRSMARACLPELTCQVSSETGTAFQAQCRRPGLAGQLCSAPLGMRDSCAEGNFCNEQHVCAALVTNGSACKDSADCVSRYCTDKNLAGVGVCRTSDLADSSPRDDPDYFCFGHPDGPGNGGTNTNPKPVPNSMCSQSTFYDGNPNYETCFADWNCQDGRYRVDCTVQDRASGAVHCSCSRDTLPSVSFDSVGFCMADRETRLRAVNQACGWTLTE